MSFSKVSLRGELPKAEGGLPARRGAFGAGGTPLQSLRDSFPREGGEAGIGEGHWDSIPGVRLQDVRFCDFCAGGR